MKDNPHFQAAPTWKAARELLTFPPIEPKYTAGFKLQSIRIHVRDHKLRELAFEDRTLEAHYRGFVVTQAWKGVSEAKRLALKVSYGPAATEAQFAGREARVYELGPETPPDDIDGRSPSVVVWHDADMFYLVASGELSSVQLLDIASSMYH